MSVLCLWTYKLIRVYCISAVLLATLSDTSSHFADAQSSICKQLTELPYTAVVKPFHDQCFQFVSEEMYWTQARSYCHMNGGHLARVDSSETQQLVESVLSDLWWKNDGVWIGLNDRRTELSWQWDSVDRSNASSNSQSTDPLLWSNWAPGYPRSNLHVLRDCVRMVRESDWRWMETPCDSFAWKYRFICQYKTEESMTGSFSYDANGKQNNDHVSTLDVLLDENVSQSENTQSVSSGVVVIILSCALAVTVLLLFIVILWKRRRQVKSFQAMSQRHLSAVVTINNTNSSTNHASPVTTECPYQHQVYNTQPLTQCNGPHTSCTETSSCLHHHQQQRCSNLYVHPQPPRLPDPRPSISSTTTLPSAFHMTSPMTTIYCPMNGVITTSLVGFAVSSGAGANSSTAAPSLHYEPMQAYISAADVGLIDRCHYGNDDVIASSVNRNMESEQRTTVVDTELSNCDNIYEPLDDVTEYNYG